MPNETRKILLETQLESLPRRLFRVLKIKNSCAEVFLLSGVEMRRLGRFQRASPKAGAKYLKKKKGHTPGVLTFVEPKGFPHPEKRGRFLGEIYINRDIARRDPRRARELLAHGLLHILGYSHDKKGDTLKMERLEKKLAEKLKM